MSLDDAVSLLYQHRQLSRNMLRYRACGDDTLHPEETDAWWRFVVDNATRKGHLVLDCFKLSTIKALRYTADFDSADTCLYDRHYWAIEMEWTTRHGRTLSSDGNNRR